MISSVLKGFTTALKGLKLTLMHLFAPHGRREIQNIAADNYFKKLEEGTNTIQYPKQKLPVPEVGRYQLDVAIEDCIVCDLCAKVCPVDCINIEPIKATELIGHTSDGSPKRIYAAQFDIDMAKCMYCGLCTIVCPTECIVMTDQYDRSVFDIKDLYYKFSDMTPEEADEKRALLERQQAERAAAKQAAIQNREGGA